MRAKIRPTLKPDAITEKSVGIFGIDTGCYYADWLILTKPIKRILTYTMTSLERHMFVKSKPKKINRT